MRKQQIGIERGMCKLRYVEKHDGISHKNS